MRKVLLTFGSILSIALPVGVSVSCGTRTSTPTGENNPSIDDLASKAGDIKTPRPIEEKDNKNKPDKPVPQVQLINPEKTKEELKDQSLADVIADAIKSLDLLILDDKDKAEIIGKMNGAKSKDEVIALRDKVAGSVGINH